MLIVQVDVRFEDSDEMFNAKNLKAEALRKLRNDFAKDVDIVNIVNQLNTSKPLP